MAIHEDSVRAELGRSAQGHGRMHAKFPRLVGCSRDHTALVALASDDDSLALQRGIKQLFHRDEESVHVDVKDSFDERGHKRIEGNSWRNCISVPAAVSSERGPVPGEYSLTTTMERVMTTRNPAGALQALEDPAWAGRR